MVRQANKGKMSWCQVGCLTVMLVFVSSSLFAGTVPDSRGSWSGSGTTVRMNCQDPADNRTSNSGSISLMITNQTRSSFAGTTTTTSSRPGFEFIETSNLSGTIAPNGTFSGSGTYSSTINGSFDASGTQTFSGTIDGNTLTAFTTATDTAGDTCTGNDFVTLTRDGLIPARIPIPMPDVNFDGTADLAWRNTSTGATATWLMNTLGLREGATFPGGAGLDWVIQGVSDIDGDGPADFVWRNTRSGATAVWLMNAVGLRAGTTFPGVVGLAWTIQGVGDVNGDGLADWVWRNTRSGATAVWLMNAVGLRAGATFPGVVGLDWELRP